MKQVTQRLRDGMITVLDVPPPAVTPETILVDVRSSLLSIGTERARTAAAKKTLIGKARARPEDARHVIEKLRRDGARETIGAVRMRLDQPSAIGYSSSGVVLEVGNRVRDLAAGDRVACGGGNRAVHADLNLVPANLCVPLPDGVSFDHGAFATGTGASPSMACARQTCASGSASPSLAWVLSVSFRFRFSGLPAASCWASISTNSWSSWHGRPGQSTLLTCVRLSALSFRKRLWNATPW